MKDFAKSIVCNTKVGNGLKDDMKRAHPNDSMVDDVKTSATYEAIVKQPWRVYDILGVDDSMIREYAFELIAKKYGVDYDTIYYAWMHNGYKLSDYRSPSQEAQAKKDFKKLGVSVSNTKAEAEKVGNFEDQKKAKYYIEMWERRRDDAKRSLQNAEGHLKEAMKHRYGDKEFNQREVQRYQEAVKAAEASIKQYDDLIKSAAKTSFGNTRTGNSKVGNADILSGNYIILADNGEVWFRDEHENVHIRNIDSWAQKRIASYQSSIDEIKKGVAEAKQAAKKAGMI